MPVCDDNSFKTFLLDDFETQKHLQQHSVGYFLWSFICQNDLLLAELPITVLSEVVKSGYQLFKTSFSIIWHTENSYIKTIFETINRGSKRYFSTVSRLVTD